MGLFDTADIQDSLESPPTKARDPGHRLTTCMYRLMVGAQANIGEAAIGELLADGLAAIGDAADAELGALLVLDEDTGELAFALTHGRIAREQLKDMCVPRGMGIAQWVVARKQPVTINDARADDRFYARIDHYTGMRTRSVVAAPIVYNGESLGALQLLNKRRGKLFSLSDQNRLCLISHFFAPLMMRLVQSS